MQATLEQLAEVAEVIEELEECKKNLPPSECEAIDAAIADIQIVLSVYDNTID